VPFYIWDIPKVCRPGKKRSPVTYSLIVRLTITSRQGQPTLSYVTKVYELKIYVSDRERYNGCGTSASIILEKVKAKS